MESSLREDSENAQVCHDCTHLCMCIEHVLAIHRLKILKNFPHHFNGF